jgi:hypothetical protein
MQTGNRSLGATLGLLLLAASAGGISACSSMADESSANSAAASAQAAADAAARAEAAANRAEAAADRAERMQATSPK